LGDDPVVFAKKRLDIARDLLKRQESRELKPSADFSVLRRSIGYALRDAGRAVGILARQIGGVRTLRDFPGSGRDPLQPVSAVVQRQALDLIASRVLAADSFVVAPELQRRLAPDYNERGDALFSGDAPMSTDYSPAGIVLDMQRALLNHLMSDGLANRILDSEDKMNRRSDAFHLTELYDRLASEVWSELRNRADIPGPRRELQRDYVNRLAALLLRPGSLTRSDARSSIRMQAKSLLERIDAAVKGAGGRRLSAEAQAHLQDSADTLREALAAHPRDESLLYALGYALERAGQGEAALAQMRALLALAPDHAEALNFVAYAYAERGERLDEAERLVRRALELEPGSAHVLDSLGWVLHRRGEHARAVEVLERAAAGGSPDPVVLEHLGDAYRAAGRPGDAAGAYRRALAAEAEGGPGPGEGPRRPSVERKLREIEGAARAPISLTPSAARR